jgi:hypothetical protein
MFLAEEQLVRVTPTAAHKSSCERGWLDARATAQGAWADYGDGGRRPEADSLGSRGGQHYQPGGGAGADGD